MSDAYAQPNKRVCKYCGATLVRGGKEAANRFATRMYCNKACTSSWWSKQRIAASEAKHAGIRHCQGCGKALVRRATEKWPKFWNRTNCDRTCADLVRTKTHVVPAPVNATASDNQTQFINTLDPLTRELLLESFELHPEFLAMLVDPGMDYSTFLGFQRPR